MQQKVKKRKRARSSPFAPEENQRRLERLHKEVLNQLRDAATVRASTQDSLMSGEFAPHFVVHPLLAKDEGRNELRTRLQRQLDKA